MATLRNKNKKPLTPLQKLLLETIGGTLGVRSRVLEAGRSRGRAAGMMKVEYAVVALVVREAHLRDELLNTTEVAEKASIDRKTAERALKRLDKAGIIRSEEIGREMKHFIPADRLDNSAAFLAPYLAMAGYLIALGDHLKPFVDKLDPDVKAKVMEAAEATTFLLLWTANVVEMTADVAGMTTLLC